MLKLTKTGIGLLTRQYRSVLHKCFLINAGVFGLMAKTLRGTLNAAAFNVADGLLASAVMATIATTLALSSPANADELERQVVEAGQKVESIEGKFTGHTLTDMDGEFVLNNGTIVNLIADVVSNSVTVSNSSGRDPLIENSPGGHIDIIRGNIKNNTLTYVEHTASDDDAFLIYNWNGYINTINVNMSDNTVTGISPNPSPMLFTSGSSLIEHIEGIFSRNVTSISGLSEGTVLGTYLSASIGDIVGNFTENAAIGKQGARGTVIAVYGDRSGKIASIKGTFTNNYAQTTSSYTAYGGVIFNMGTIDSIWDSNFVGNYAQSTSGTAQGGAIYNDNKIGIDAVNSNVYFYNNRAIQGENARYNDIYNTGTLELNASGNNSIIFNGSIEGSSGKININTDNLSGGTYVFNNAISGNSVTIGSSTATAPVNIKLGTVQQADSSTSYGLLSGIALTNNGLNTLLDLRNENIDTHSLTTLTLNNQMNLAIDAQLSGASGSADRINVSGSKTTAANSLIVSAINLDNTTYNGSSDKVTIQLTTDSTLKNAYTLSSDIMNNISGNNYYTSVTYDKTTGSLIFDDKLINHSTLDSILANNYYTNVKFSMAKSFIKAANDNNFTTLNCVKEA